jgi:TatA/E family protein of Tat protein translocase
MSFTTLRVSPGLQTATAQVWYVEEDGVVQSTAERKHHMIGSQDLMVGLVIAVVLFGAKKLPELAGSVGKSLKEFKKGMAEATEDSPAAPIATQPTALPAAKMCATCQTSVQTDWLHCPRCGAPAR